MQRLASLLFLLSLAAFVGCPPPQPDPPKNALEWFQQTAKDLPTPQGEIDMDSIRAEGEDTVVYQTVDDSGQRRTWRLKIGQTREGEYLRDGEPTLIPDEKP